MYRYDNRVVITLDAGGTNLVFGAMQANKFIVEPITMPSNADDLDKCLATMVEGFQAVIDKLEAKPVAISFAFPGPADYPNGIIGGYLPNFPSFREGVALGPFLEYKFGIPVFINNDGDLFAYGEEGVDWEYNEQGLITRHNPAWDIPAYTQGTFFNLTQETEYNQYEEEVRPLNDNAVPSVMLGFFFDTTNVQDQLASCIEIFNRYKNEVLTGTTDPTVSVPQMMEEMRAAGFDEIVAEAQTQVDAFLGK